MKTLNTNGLRALKVVHLICAIIWIGSAIVMNLLRLLVNVDNAAGMYYMAEILEAIDMQILVPGAVGCLLTGIVYGFFTKWGFFKHRWITVKWILTIFMISVGTFCMGPLIEENVVIGFFQYLQFLIFFLFKHKRNHIDIIINKIFFDMIAKQARKTHNQRIRIMLSGPCFQIISVQTIWLNTISNTTSPS